MAITAPDPANELRDFYNYIWGTDKVAHDGPVFVYLPVEYDGVWTKVMYEWPRQRESVIRHTLKWSASRGNVFYSPALFFAANPQKDNVLGSHVLWVDFDGNAPQEWDAEIPPPTLIIQSSIPGHEHCYWRLNEFLTDRDLLEDRNRSLAYLTHADTSGWDADQILRPPYTVNHKRNKPVFVKEWDL
jgi:hypothetical protein